MKAKKRVVIVGSGFAGATSLGSRITQDACRRFKSCHADVTEGVDHLLLVGRSETASQDRNGLR